MLKSRPPYPPAFRRQMVELGRTGRTAEELAREFEPTAQALRNWVAQAERDEGRRADGLSSAEREEMRRLRRENRRLREEREWRFSCLPKGDRDWQQVRRTREGFSEPFARRTPGLLGRSDPGGRPVHESVQGCQYTSFAFGERCRRWGVVPSMGSVGECFDNAMAESFFATLECERLDRTHFHDPRSSRGQAHHQAHRAIFEFIEGWYHPHRRHRGLGQQSPIAFERSYQDAA